MRLNAGKTLLVGCTSLFKTPALIIIGAMFVHLLTHMKRRCVVTNDIVTRLRRFGSSVSEDWMCVDLAADEIERLRKLMSDYVSLWHQIDKDVNVQTSQAYYSKFYEMEKEVRGE